MVQEVHYEDYYSFEWQAILDIIALSIASCICLCLVVALFYLKFKNKFQDEFDGSLVTLTIVVTIGAFLYNILFLFRHNTYRTLCHSCQNYKKKICNKLVSS